MILLVDTDEDVLRTLASMIESAGYPVIAVNSPIEAIKKAAVADSLELLISDIHMPEMDGFELYRQLQTIQPRIRSLFFSGFLDPNALPKLGCKVAVIRKPFGVKELTKKIATIVGQPPAMRGNK